MSDFKRKLEHIEIALRDDIVFSNNCRELYREVVLIHQAIPKLSLNEVDTTTRFLGYELSYPVVIEAMTGGHIELRQINEKLATAASQFNIAIGVGSQRPIIKSGYDPNVIESYRVVRRIAQNVPVIGNIGIAQLRSLKLEELRKLVEVIEADALAIHLNPAQEAIQPEGDHDFREDLILRIEELIRDLGVPIVIKEVGHGLSMEVVSELRKKGVKIFDVAGACGTDWVKIEAYRNPENSVQRVVGFELNSVNWGIPTPLSLIETRNAAPDAMVIASGGVWSGVNAVKMLALGGDLVGLARPLLKALLTKGYDGLKQYLEVYTREIKIVMFLVGASSIKDLKRKPIVLGPTIRSYLEQRGIDVRRYLEKTRCGVND